jgi:integrase
MDLDEGFLTVSATLQRVRGDFDPARGHYRTHLAEKVPKTERSQRRLALPEYVRDALREHQQEQRKEQTSARHWSDRDLVFTTPLGTPLEQRNVLRDWHSLCERAGIERPLRVHDLRHAAASFWLEEGADMRSVMEALGHSRMATTSDIYAHLSDEGRRLTASRMDGFLRSIQGASVVTS